MRTCPRCAFAGPADAFPLLPPRIRPARHDDRRRRCPRCGFTGKAWTFTPHPERQETRP